MAVEALRAALYLWSWPQCLVSLVSWHLLALGNVEERESTLYLGFK